MRGGECEMIESVYLSKKFPTARLYFDKEQKRFKLYVSNGEDSVTVDLSARSEEYARDAIEWISLIIGDF